MFAGRRRIGNKRRKRRWRIGNKRRKRRWRRKWEEWRPVLLPCPLSFFSANF
jgi:hypothetical protein